MTTKESLIAHIQGFPDELSPDEIEKRVRNFMFQQKEKKLWKSIPGRILFATSMILAVLTLAIITDWFQFKQPDGLSYIDVIAYSVWTLIPPAWFLYEYAWLFPDEYKLDSDHLDDMKYTQELAGKIWAAVLVLITIILYIKYGTGDLFPKPNN